MRVVTAALGAAATIAGITAAPAAASARLLQTRPMVAIGKLSYSRYLWHWPLLAFSRILAPGNGSLARALAVAFGALVLAAVTFIFVENPIRQRRPWPLFGVYPTLAVGAAISLMVALLAVALELQADAATRRDPWLGAIAAAARTIPAKPGCNFAGAFTALAPAAECAVGAPGVPPRILVWGDSQAEQLKAMMTADGARGAYAAAIWSKSDCPPLVPASSRGPNAASACLAFNRAVAAELPVLAQAGLGGIVLASRYFGFPGAWSPLDELAAWRAGLQDILSTARGLNIRVVLIAPIPMFRLPLPECLAHGSAAQCGASRANFERGHAPLLAALRETVKDYDDVRIWDPADLLCDASLCTPMRDGTIMYSDRGHLSVLGAQALAADAAPQLDWLRGQR
jgi:lysophospholipase L1-like esterase